MHRKDAVENYTYVYVCYAVFCTFIQVHGALGYYLAWWCSAVWFNLH